MVGDDNGYKPPVPTKPLMPGVLLLPPGPNGEKWGIDDYAAQRDWGIDDFNAFTHPLGKVFNLETGEFVAAKNGLTQGQSCWSSSGDLGSENDDQQRASQLPALTVEAFLESAPQSYEWICEGIVAKGAVTKFAGKAKEAGKTTFIMSMVADLLQGTPFLGRETKKSRVLYLSEQASNLREALKDAGLEDTGVENLFLLPAHLVAHMPWPELMSTVRAYCVAYNIDLLVIDTLVDFSDVESDEENSSGKVRSALKHLTTHLAYTHNIAVIFSQHHNLEGRGRGSTQFEGGVDIVIDLRTPDQVPGDLDQNTRSLEAIGRGVHYKQLIRFTKDDGYEPLNRTDELLTATSKKAKVVLRFLPVLEAEARTVTELLDALKDAGRDMSRSTVQRSLTELVNADPPLAAQKGEGTKHDPIRYWRQEPMPESDEEQDPNTQPQMNGEDDQSCWSSFGDSTSENDDQQDSQIADVIPLHPKIDGKDADKKKKKPLPPAPEELAKQHEIYVHTNERLSECLEWAIDQPYMSIDSETKGKNKDEATLYTKATIRGVTLYAEGTTWFLDCDHLADEAVKPLLRELADDRPKYFHNSAFDVPRLFRRFGVLLNKNVKDTLIAARTARAGEWEEKVNEKGKKVRPKKGLKLEECLMRELGVTVPKDEKTQKGSAWFGDLTEDHLTYAADDVVYLKDLYVALTERIEALGVNTAYEAIEGVVHVFLEAAVSGIPIDARQLETIQNEVRAERDGYELVLETLADEHAPHPDGGQWSFGNTNKPDATDEHGNKIGRNGALRMLQEAGVKLPNLEEQTLLDNLDKHPLVKALYDYRAAAREYSKYRRILEDFYEDGYMFPQVKIAGAVTGRVLYADTNIQGFDKKKTDKYRKCVRADEGHSIVKGDFAQQELRIAAWWSEDEALLTAFANGEDVYMRVAEKIAGKPVKRGTKEGDKARAAAKRAVLGYLYGLGPVKYKRNVYKDTGAEISEEEAYRDRAAFREAYPGFYKWQKKYGSYKDETNLRKPDMWETRSVRGWRRMVAGQYERKSEWKKKNNVPADWIPKYTERLNGPIQSTAGDILYLTLTKLDTDLTAGLHPGTRFLFTAHDEVVLTCPEGVAQDVAAWLKHRMVEAFEEILGSELGGLKSVEVGTGPSWGETA